MSFEFTVLPDERLVEILGVGGLTLTKTIGKATSLPVAHDHFG